MLNYILFSFKNLNLANPQEEHTAIAISSLSADLVMPPPLIKPKDVLSFLTKPNILLNKPNSVLPSNK